MEPSDEELLGLMPQQLRDDLATVARMAAHGAGPDVTPELFEGSLTAGALQFARAVLAHRGHQPALPVEGEEAVKAVRPSRRQLIMLADDMGMASVSEAAEYARAVLARYGHQPAPHAEGEVADLIAWLGDEADQYDCIQQAPETARRLRRAADLFAQRQPAPPAEGEVAELVAALRSQAIDCTCDHLTSGDLRRAADLLEQRHPEPVPVSERLPWLEDCDAEGLCWVWHTTACTWGLFRLDPTVHSHWLPATALPLPAGELQP